MTTNTLFYDPYDFRRALTRLGQTRSEVEQGIRYIF